MEADVPDDIPVVFDDDRLIAFAKPAGLPVLPGGGFLENTMLALVRARHGARLSPVQRLDRGTSGVILFSKTREAAALLSALFREKRVRKTYLALVHGTDMRDSFDAVSENPRTLRKACSTCTVLTRDAQTNTSIVKVETSTGETHQVRHHLALSGHPLVNDLLYKADGAMVMDETQAVRLGLTGACGFLLHAWRLRLPYPDEHGIEITAPPPAVLYNLMVNSVET
jgi:23S rRNA pseudouridine1911/1915/1917 synthase